MINKVFIEHLLCNGLYSRHRTKEVMSLHLWSYKLVKETINNVILQSKIMSITMNELKTQVGR